MKRMLADVRPELVNEWSQRNLPLTPDSVTHGSNKIVWWNGKCGHEWRASVKNRVIGGSGCPYCSHNAILEGYNDLASQKPELAAEWSARNAPLLPTQVTVFANRKAWWKCKECGNEWETLITTRSDGSKCPYCSGIILLKGFNDLATTQPKIAPISPIIAPLPKPREIIKTITISPIPKEVPKLVRETIWYLWKY